MVSQIRNDDSNINHIKTTLTFAFIKYCMSRETTSRGFGVHKNCSSGYACLVYFIL